MRSKWLVLVLAFTVVLAAVGLAMGCSSSSKGQQVNGDAGDATSEGVTADQGAPDAGPDIDQDPDVYPAQHHPVPQLDYNGGPILQHVRVVTVTFVGDVHRDSFRAFDHFILTSAWWKQTAEGYCIDGGANAGCVGDGTATAPEGGAWISRRQHRRRGRRVPRRRAALRLPQPDDRRLRHPNLVAGPRCQRGFPRSRLA